jgi:ERF superfamily
MDNFTASNHPNQSEDIRQFGISFLKAKMHFGKTGLDGTNTHFKSKYAPLPKVYEAVESALAQQGISIWHHRTPAENGLHRIFTRLTHVVSGQWVQDVVEADFKGKTQQQVGAEMTYIYKKAVMGLCSIHYDNDDDGESERKYVEEKKVKEIAKENKINNHQIGQLLKASKNNQDAIIDVLEAHGIDSIENVRQDQFLGIFDEIISKS